MQSRVIRIRESGFTLTELMVVVLILAVLILIAVASFAFTTRTAARATCENNRRTFDTAIEIYRNDHTQADPGDLAGLAPYIANFDTAKTCPGDGTTLLRYDPDLKRTVCDFHE